MPYARYRLAGSDPFLDAALDLPNGAEIIEFQLQACDTSASGEVTAWITRQPNETGLLQELAQTATGLAATPGCTTLTTNVTPPIVVNNQQYYHGVQAEMGLGNAMRLVGMRVGYRLRVSPAPAVATFPNDVPTTHPFFQWIEALAASGITAGCGAGSFCPDMPVTRGQMAVFLAAALGLHFPN
jgi:hypothetical protein